MVRERFDLDKVFFVPSNLPPHKADKNMAAAEERLRMVRMAVRGNKDFGVSDFEVKKKGKSYSIDTVTYFKKRYPEAKIFFIIGSDHLLALHTWRRIDDILKLVSFVAVYRPGYKAVRSRIKVRSIVVPGVHTSSSDIRRRIASGKTVRYLVPEGVLRHVKKYKLYSKI